MSDRRDTQAGRPGHVVMLEGRRRRIAPVDAATAPGHPVAFGVELLARADLVFSVAALTQLITIADHAGVDAAGDLGRAIAALRRRLQVHDVGLPPALEALIEDVSANAGRAGLHVFPGGRE